MILSKEDLLRKISVVIGDDTSDEALSLLEDVSDTLDASADDDAKKWEDAYYENDKMWREKYRDRFLSASTDTLENVVDVDEESSDGEEELASYDELFEEEKGD